MQYKLMVHNRLGQYLVEVERIPPVVEAGVVATEQREPIVYIAGRNSKLYAESEVESNTRCRVYS